jgi:hypothetical protein
MPCNLRTEFLRRVQRKDRWLVRHGLPRVTGVDARQATVCQRQARVGHACVRRSAFTSTLAPSGALQSPSVRPVSLN